MSKHTRGPWTIEENEMMGRDIVSAGSMALICTQVYSPDDARLIAAAPELLAALVSAKEALDNCPWSDTVFDADDIRLKVESAIAKATGSES
jgi:hypothetical protein